MPLSRRWNRQTLRELDRSRRRSRRQGHTYLAGTIALVLAAVVAFVATGSVPPVPQISHTITIEPANLFKPEGATRYELRVPVTGGTAGLELSDSDQPGSQMTYYENQLNHQASTLPFNPNAATGLVWIGIFLLIAALACARRSWAHYHQEWTIV